MVSAIIVKNVDEALLYKKKYPHLLTDARLYFPDDESANVRPKNVDYLYYTKAVGPHCRILSLVQSVNSPIQLHI